MNISTYVRMTYDELADEIVKQKKKIKAAQETIRLLEKLQIAEQHKERKAENNNSGNGEMRYGQH